ncbi:hypothetical protein Tco_1051838 [Tanacetum coccineum]
MGGKLGDLKITKHICRNEDRRNNKDRICNALMNVHSRVEGAKKHAAALRKLMIDIVSNPLSSQTWVGEASTSAAPLSIEDYQEEDTDEALGSVVAIPQLEVPYL